MGKTVEIETDVLRELVEALNRKGEREDRLIRALENIAQNEQRKLNHEETRRAKALAKSGPTTQEDIDQVRRVMARRRGTK